MVHDAEEDQVAGALEADSTEVDDPWAARAEAWNGLLDKFDIRASQGTDFHPFPYVTPQDRWTARVVNAASGGFKVEVLSQVQGKKTVLVRHTPEVKDAWVAGWFKNPFEDRILVVVGEETAGFEGNEVTFVFAGCRLNSGFKAP